MKRGSEMSLYLWNGPQNKQKWSPSRSSSTRYEGWGPSLSWTHRTGQHLCQRDMARQIKRSQNLLSQCIVLQPSPISYLLEFSWATTFALLVLTVTEAEGEAVKKKTNETNKHKQQILFNTVHDISYISEHNYNLQQNSRPLFYVWFYIVSRSTF